MLAANEAVAESFTVNNKEAIYRIHEKPEPEKVKEFTSFAQSLGITLPPPDSDPSWFGKVLGIVRDTPTEYVVNNLLLRTMQQARYDTINQGHFGLAATDYTHFTSPIRRYPDLLVHRILKAMLINGKVDNTGNDMVLKEQASYLSSRERIAIKAERDMNDRLKIFFMEKFIGENFDAIISGVNESALFIELLDLFISGSIDINQLKDDYYLYDAKRYQLIGEISGKSYQLGNSVKVTLADVDHQRKRLNFIPAPTESED
jgi:ribonuclease R